MRHDPASGAIGIMLRSLKMHGMAEAVTDLIEQGVPAFEAAISIRSQQLKAGLAEREVRSIGYHMKADRFPPKGTSPASTSLPARLTRPRSEHCTAASSSTGRRTATRWPLPSSRPSSEEPPLAPTRTSGEPSVTSATSSPRTNTSTTSSPQNSTRLNATRSKAVRSLPPLLINSELVRIEGPASGDPRQSPAAYRSPDFFAVSPNKTDRSATAWVALPNAVDRINAAIPQS